MLENEDENTHNVLMTLWGVDDGFHQFCHQYCESANYEVANIATLEPRSKNNYGESDVEVHRHYQF